MPGGSFDDGAQRTASVGVSCSDGAAVVMTMLLGGVHMPQPSLEAADVWCDRPPSEP
jgi:hypothetical protein